MEPRLFLIKNDGTGSELLSEKQLANYFRCKQKEIKESLSAGTKLVPVTKRFDMENLEGMENSKIVSFLTKLVREKDALSHLSFIKGIEMPRIIDNLQQSIVIQKEPPLQVYTYRCILIHPLFDEKKREMFSKDFERYKQWKEKIEKTKNSFGISDNRSPEELEEEKKIQVMILNQRKGKDKALNQEEIKGKAIKDGMESDKSHEEEQKEEEIVDEEAGDKAEEKKQGNSKGSQKLAAKKETKQIIPDTVGPAPSALGAQKNIEGALVATLKSRGSDAMTGTISQISSTAEFVANYFFTKKGMEVKYEPVSEEKLKKYAEKQRKAVQGQLRPEEAQEKGKGAAGTDDQGNIADTHNPIMALEPENTTQKNKQTQQMKSLQSSLMKQSHFKESIARMQDIEQKEKSDAENYHVSKTKDFTVFGAPRVTKPVVPILHRPKPQAEINEQYISIDAITDRRIKTMSMANRGYANAPPVQTIRKQGQHQMIARALNKKQTFEELMAETNSMINYALNDPNKRNFVIIPPVARFGKLKVGSVYETTVVCKNEDAMPQRFTIRQPKSIFIRAYNTKPGPVAQGMTAPINVEITCTDKDAAGMIQDEFQLITKTEIYKVSIFAHVLSPEEFDSYQAEAFKLHNRPLLLPTVKEKGKDEKKAIIMEGSLEPAGNAILIKLIGISEANETSLSGVKLPKINQGDDTKIELDPTKKLDDILKKDKAPKESDNYH